jgi:8-oxo-dGTP pyrophosphatase MutT (NUDIX family)
MFTRRFLERAGILEQAERALKILFPNKWCEVVDYTEEGQGQYTYVREPNTHGQRVAVLPFDRGEVIKFLMRAEPVVSWMDEPHLREPLFPCAVTGGMEDQREDPADAALRELAEETGYALPQDRLVDLGQTRTVKCLSTVYHLFGADVTGLMPKLSTTDGTIGESGCRIVWTRTPHHHGCAIASTMFARLGDHVTIR